MRKLSLAMMCLAIAGLMTMVSCRKPNIFNGKKLTFKATIDNNGAKTTLYGDEDVRWTAGDQVRINGNNDVNLFDVDVDKDDKTKATITGMEVNPVNEGYLASYPTSGTNNGEQVTFNIPANQRENGTDLSGKIPMVAWTTEKGGYLKFHNMVNILKLNLQGNRIIKKIEVSSTAENLNGTFTVSKDGDDLKPTTISGKEDSQRTITIDNIVYPLSTVDVTSVYVMLPVFSSADNTISLNFTTSESEVKTVEPIALKDQSSTPNPDLGSNKPSHVYALSVSINEEVSSQLEGFNLIDYPVNP